MAANPDFHLHSLISQKRFQIYVVIHSQQCIKKQSEIKSLSFHWVKLFILEIRTKRFQSERCIGCFCNVLHRYIVSTTTGRFYCGSLTCACYPSPWDNVAKFVSISRAANKHPLFSRPDMLIFITFGLYVLWNIFLSALEVHKKIKFAENRWSF